MAQAPTQHPGLHIFTGVYIFTVIQKHYVITVIRKLEVQNNDFISKHLLFI